MPGADVTCSGCSQSTFFEYPEDHENSVIRWDCPSCGVTNGLEFPEVAERKAHQLHEQVAAGIESGVRVVNDSDVATGHTVGK